MDDDLGCASYLIGDEAAGEAVVARAPRRYAVEPYLEEAEQAGVRIVRVLETHNSRRPSLRSRPARAGARDAR